MAGSAVDSDGMMATIYLVWPFLLICAIWHMDGRFDMSELPVFRLLLRMRYSSRMQR
jgi:hypothetical protein